jgi:hypothetical protein
VSFISSNSFKPSSFKCSLFFTIKNAFLKASNSKDLDPYKGYLEKKGIIFSSKSFKEVTVKSQALLLRFSTLPQPK